MGRGAPRGGAPGAAGGVSTAGAGTRQWVLGQARAGTMAWCWYVQGARGEGARRGPVLASARAGNINRVGVDERMYRTREQQQDLITSLRLGLRGLDAVDARGLCGNQPVCRVHNSPRSHFSAMTRPCRLRRAVRNRHSHAIEQASRRWRAGHDHHHAIVAVAGPRLDDASRHRWAKRAPRAAPSRPGGSGG